MAATGQARQARKRARRNPASSPIEAARRSLRNPITGGPIPSPMKLVVRKRRAAAVARLVGETRLWLLAMAGAITLAVKSEGRKRRASAPVVEPFIKTAA